MDDFNYISTNFMAMDRFPIIMIIKTYNVHIIESAFSFLTKLDQICVPDLPT